MSLLKEGFLGCVKFALFGGKEVVGTGEDEGTLIFLGALPRHSFSTGWWSTFSGGPPVIEGTEDGHGTTKDSGGGVAYEMDALDLAQAENESKIGGLWRCSPGAKSPPTSMILGCSRQAFPLIGAVTLHTLPLVLLLPQ